MALYTMIIDWKGGTYVFQGQGESPYEGALVCVENWDISIISDIITPTMKLNILEEIEKDRESGVEFTALQGLTNIWSSDVTLQGSTMLMNLILTQDKDEKHT